MAARKKKQEQEQEQQWRRFQHSEAQAGNQIGGPGVTT
jgi:hypothetical protein